MNLLATAEALPNESVFSFGELGMQEFRTCELMSSLLKGGGLLVDLTSAVFRPPFAQLTAHAPQSLLSTRGNQMLAELVERESERLGMAD